MSANIDVSLSDEALARAALRDILADRGAPAAARASAARTLAEMAGALGKHQARPDAGMGNAFEMTREEMSEELRALARGKA